MKKLLLGSLLAASTCIAMIAPATAATNTAAPNSAQMQHKDGTHKGPLSKINLTATQQAQVKSIHDKYRSQGKDGRQKARAEIAKVLTAQQRSQLETMKAEHKGTGEHRGHGN